MSEGSRLQGSSTNDMRGRPDGEKHSHGPGMDLDTDRRLSHRFVPPLARAECKTNETGPARYSVVDLSLGGALLAGPSVPIDEVVRVRLQSLGRAAHWTRARVVRQCSHKGAEAVAVAFSDPAPDTAELIVDMALEAKALSRRERRHATPGLRAEASFLRNCASYEVVNLSVSGALLEGPQPLGLGAWLELTLVAPRRTARVNAQVVRRPRSNDAWRLGVAFDPPSPETLRRIEDIIMDT